MSARVLVAGIGNIFHADDAFGVRVAQQLASEGPLDGVTIMDVGIRGIDLAFALLEPYELVILVDATQRGGSPGTLYTIEIQPSDIPDRSDEDALVNSHGLDPVRVLTLAKSLGARLETVLLVACEPGVVDSSETGYIGLSDVVEAAVNPALKIVRDLVENRLVETVIQRGDLS
jgi:hydrogenase maturation protease